MTNKLDTNTDAGQKLLLARLPIFNAKQEVIAFEIVCRDHKGNPVEALLDKEIAKRILSGAYSGVSRRGEIVTLPCIIKVSENFILNNDNFLLDADIGELPKSNFMLEISEGIKVSEEFIRRTKDFTDQGYRLALSEFHPESRHMLPMLDFFNHVRIDCQKITMEDLLSVHQRFRRYGFEFVAANIATREQFKTTSELGFKLFMGQFLNQRIPIKGKKIVGNKLVLLQLLTELNKKEVTADSIEELALQDPALTFRILQVVNSAAFSLVTEIKSLSHAIRMLGLNQVKRWVLLFITNSGDGKPDALTTSMLTRGRMCELLAEMNQLENSSTFFMVGLLSQLDLLLDIEMEELLGQVPLNREIKEALLSRAGPAGKMLKEVEYYETGDFASLNDSIPVTFHDLAYRLSLEWVQETMQAMQQAK